MKKVIPVIIMSLLIISMHIKAEQLNKVGPALNYWYNFYFDPGWIEHVEDSINNMQPHQTVDGLDLLPPPKLEPGKPWIGFRQAPIEYIDGVPHVWSLISYTGDGSDLEDLGVLVRSNYSPSIAGVSFPLSILPKVISLPTVVNIPDRAVVEPLKGDQGHHLPNNVSNKYGNISLILSGERLFLSEKIQIFGEDFPIVYNITCTDSTVEDTSSRLIVIDSLFAGLYNLIYRPLDSTLLKQSISQIVVFPDSCTEVQLVARSIENVNMKMAFHKWKRNKINVREITSNRIKRN